MQGVITLNDDENTTIAPMIEAKNAAKELVDTIIKSNPEGVRVAVVTYGYDYLSSYSCGFTNSLTKLKNTISSIPDEYETKGTNLYAGLKQADSLLKESSAKNKFVVPGKTQSEILKLITDDKKDVEIIVGQRHINFKIFA